MRTTRWEALLNRMKHVPINDEPVGQPCDYCWRPSTMECIKCGKRLCQVHLDKPCDKKEDIRRKR